MKFRRVLFRSTLMIANRGEIACRVAATAHRMGLRTVAVYSDADANARHVAACDTAVHIGGPEPRASYLRGDVIIEAARQTGAQAIHPGYGFLSENEAFRSEEHTSELQSLMRISNAVFCLKKQ